MNKNNYVVKEGDVLVGSSLLKRKDDNSDRVSYMLNHIQENQVMDFYKKTYLKLDNKPVSSLFLIISFIKYDDNNTINNANKVNFHEIATNITSKSIAENIWGNNG